MTVIVNLGKSAFRKRQIAGHFLNFQMFEISKNKPISSITFLFSKSWSSSLAQAFETTATFDCQYLFVSVLFQRWFARQNALEEPN